MVLANSLRLTPPHVATTSRIRATSCVVKVLPLNRSVTASMVTACILRSVTVPNRTRNVQRKVPEHHASARGCHLSQGLVAGTEEPTTNRARPSISGLKHTSAAAADMPMSLKHRHTRWNAKEPHPCKNR